MPHSLRSSLQPAPFMPVEPLVCVVDDDDAVRLSIRLLIETLGLEVRAFATALDFLADAQAREACHCLVLDVRMPGLSGTALQERLVREGISAAGEATMGKFTGLGADTRAGS